LHDDNGPIWLDELDPERGRDLEIIVPDCGLFCEIPIFEKANKAGKE
jgi:hypothetical protein